MKILFLIVLVFALTSACNFSCFQSSCRTTGGSGERCQCTTLTDRGVTRYHAMCTARGATSCEKTDDLTGCSIHGNNAQCTLTRRTSGAATWYVSYCQANSASRCSQKLAGSNCEVVGENARCTTGILSYRGAPWIVPLCQADRALQCSVNCGTSACDRDCTGTGKRADCHCFVQSSKTQVFLSAKCNCV
ncbi:hypothetical protein GEMRC1_001331 [Eukaryota sp. GEM-RC1]